MRYEAAVQHLKLLGGVWLSSFVLGACGGAPIPHERMASAEAAARSAQEVGAQNAPQAALHLKLAQEQITLAKQLVEKGENERADFVLIRAKADAELALALAKEANAKGDAQRALEQVKSMQGGN